MILVYVAVRFRRIGGWSAGAMAIVALLHDMFVVYGVFVLLRIPLNGNFIAAMLTIPMSYPSFTVFSSIQYITTLRRATRVNQLFRAHKYIVLHECTLQHCRRICERTANCNQPEVIVRNDTLRNRKIAVL